MLSTMPSTLTARAREILGAIVREYILTGDAVGSRTLVRRHGIQQSPATVRNVMAELEEHGLLAQPHTSAGRVPTDAGLRLYVDRLMQVRELSTKEKNEIRSRFQLSQVELQELLREVSRVLSELSQQCALVLVPRTEASRLARLEFVFMRQDQLIAVLVMDSGKVVNRLLQVKEPLLPDELEGVHRYLNELCEGKSLAEIRALVQLRLEEERTRYDLVRARALALGAQAVAEFATDEVVVEGQSRLLDSPLAHDPELARTLLRAMDEKKLILRLLDETIHAEGVQVFIGAETKEEQMRSCAMVATAYGGATPLGTLGVIGPSSMDYPRVIPVVDFAAALLTEILGRG
jgi:heat-inducible transcriptional repressor